ncbi:hypothetical protein [Williamsia phyllosphaerae]|uniref:Uncharacterized protein n=1 Tax=Williamsia phyllosphaerae TaxID=885042 RepID=A0ABQ1UDE3_9NOCA|nr:hypothetical protein [Williamsia phyllosphaerae]GGF13618.1 hypothetical protein GCM10007298_06950 [Williamsia phyllosphaerae]
MGFFDTNCMITGLSLSSARATAVILRRSKGADVPTSVGIHGTYDRYGTIDLIEEDAASDRVVEYFVDAARVGSFIGDQDPTDRDVEGLLRVLTDSNLVFENIGQPTATLEGDLVTFALIASTVWESICAGGLRVPDGPPSLAVRAFGVTPLAAHLDASSSPDVDASLRELLTVDATLADVGLRWASVFDPDQRFPSDGAQHSHDEIVPTVGVARRTYRDHPAILAGVEACIRESEWDTWLGP